MVDERSKWMFWSAVAALFVAVCVPSAYFLDAFQRYRRFFSGVDPAALRPVKVNFVPHRDGRRGVAPREGLDFVEFAMKRPTAKSVSLIGDFNGWNASAMPLAREDGGRWEIVVPLPKGRHRYQFVVDGEPQPDPSNPETEDAGGREASVRSVK